MPGVAELIADGSNQPADAPSGVAGVDLHFIAAPPLRIDRALWTARQRQSHSLHEIAYRACFKAELPAFFITRLTQPGDRVYDPFAGRGTTAVEAALQGRRVASNDINPLSVILARPRIAPPDLEAVRERLGDLSLTDAPSLSADDPDLTPFYHPDTERELRALRHYLRQRANAGAEDDVDRWIRMVATNRLTGHSKGFFSVYTLPPNQAVTPDRQRLINQRLGQSPAYRDIRAIILRKSAQLLRDLNDATRARMCELARDAIFITGRAQETPALADESVRLTVTSPPFLDVVDYARDNWLRCWFNDIDVAHIAKRMSTHASLDAWADDMRAVLRELFRVTQRGGYVAFEVGEVRRGNLELEGLVQQLGEDVGFSTRAILINRQQFTKTSNIWGIVNNQRGTNTNRIVLFQKT